MRWLWIVLITSFNADARWLSMSESPTIINKLHMNYQVRKDGTMEQEVIYSITVQSEDAKANSSIMTIDFNAETDQVELLEAYTKNGNQRINVEKGAIQDRDKGDSRDYDSMKVRSVVYPQVEIGSELFIHYRIQVVKPLMKDRWSTFLQFSPGLYTKDLRVRVKSEIPLYVESRDPRKLISVSSSAKIVEVKNRKTLPGWVHAEKDPFFHPSGLSEVWISSEKNWTPFLADLELGYSKILAAGLPDKLRAWVSAAEKKKNPQDKIKFTLEKISREFRYFGDWRRHDGGLIPRSLKEIESSRYGDCKDLASLVSALFRAMKMDANVALIRRGENPYGDEPDYKLPAAGRFNHAIVNVKVAGKTYWLDPTNPVASLKPFPDISGRPAWVMGEKGGAFERLPALQADDFQHNTDYAYDFSSPDNVKVQVRARMKQLAPYRISNELLMYSKSEVLSNTLEFFSEGQEVSKFDYKKPPSTDRTLKDMDIDLDYTAGQVGYNAGRATFWVIPDGILEGAFFETESRESDLRLNETPFVFRGTRRLKASRLAQEPPQPCQVKSPWMEMERKVRSDGEDVVVEQRFDLKKAYITRDEFRSPQFRKLQKETKRCFHRSGVLIQSSHEST